MVSAAPASADPIADLRSAIAAKRGSCPALQADPLLDGVAQRANQETLEYSQGKARFQPMEDPRPILRQLSLPAAKAKMFAGFAGADQPDGQQRAIYGATLFGWETIPDCGFTRYGADVATNATGSAAAVIVLVGD